MLRVITLLDNGVLTERRSKDVIEFLLCEVSHPTPKYLLPKLDGNFTRNSVYRFH